MVIFIYSENHYSLFTGPYKAALHLQFFFLLSQVCWSALCHEIHIFILLVFVPLPSVLGRVVIHY